MVFKFAILVMIVFLNITANGRYLLVNLEAEVADKGFEARQDNRECKVPGEPCWNFLQCCPEYYCFPVSVGMISPGMCLLKGGRK